FTVSDYGPTNARDTDLGSSSAVIIPERLDSTTPRLLLTAGKDGRAYLINRSMEGRGLGGVSTQAAPTELQRLRIAAGMRMSPSYYEDEAGWSFVYVTGPGQGTFTDWEDGSVNVGPGAAPARRGHAALGSGPSGVEFNGRLFVAWIDNTPAREVRVKSSPNSFDWTSASTDPIPVGGQAAIRTSPSLAVFNDTLYLAW